MSRPGIARGGVDDLQSGSPVRAHRFEHRADHLVGIEAYQYRVAIPQRSVGPAGTGLDQRIGLVSRAIPDKYFVAGAQQAVGEGRAHQPQTEDANAGTPGARWRRVGQGLGRSIVAVGRGHGQQADRP